MDPKEVITVTDLASKGVVIDTPPASLPANIFTDARNVRFKDGAIRKIEGEVLLNNITLSANDYDKVRYIAYWPNPNRTPLGGYYIFVIDYKVAGSVVGQKVFIQDHTGTTTRDITPTSMTNGFSATNSGWQHTLFSGGFTFILNNGIDKPHYLKDTEGNVDINAIDNLAALPGWDSYNSENNIFNETWDEATMTRVFDLATITDFTVENLVVTVESNTVTFNAGNSGSLPVTLTLGGQNVVLSLDTETNTHILTFAVGALSDTNTVAINFKTINPVQIRAGVVRSFGDLLVAGNLTEVDSVTPANTVRRLTGTVRTSDVARAGELPSNWNPFESSPNNTADEFTLSETNVIKDMVSLQGSLYIYTTQSIHIMSLTGSPSTPVSFQNVSDAHGAIATNVIKEFEGKHFVVGTNDIYLFAGHPGDIRSVGDGRVRQYFFNNLNPIYEQQIFSLQNPGQNEIWLCYPTINSLFGECDEALIWNYRSDTWTIRDLESVTAGDVAPIKGGGMPTATVKIQHNSSTNKSGDFGYINRGKVSKQKVTINGSTAKPHRGVRSHKNINIDLFNTFTAAVNIQLTVSFPDGVSVAGDGGLIASGTSVTVALIKSTIQNMITTNSSWSILYPETNDNIKLMANLRQPVSENFSVTVTDPSGNLTNSKFTGTELRAGLNPSTSTDSITVVSPVGDNLIINFDTTSSTETYDIDGGVGYATTPDISAATIAAKIENAWNTNNHTNTDFTVTHTPGDEHLDFTCSSTTTVNNETVTVNRKAVSAFAYTVTNGDSRVGANIPTLVSSSTSNDIDTSTASYNLGVDAVFNRGTRVTLTLNNGTVIFDKHYGEGPGRILDTTFTPGISDNPYGSVDAGTPVTNNTDYLGLFYNADATQDGTETGKSNGLSVSLSQNTALTNQTSTSIDLVATNPLLDIKSVLTSNQEVNVTADNNTAPTVLTITSRKFSADANYVQTYVPLTTQAAPLSTSSSSTATLVAASEGVSVPSIDAAPTTTGSSISTTFDIERPWSSSNLNPNKLFPIFSQSGTVSNTLFNRIRAADIGTQFDSTNYISYVERSQVSISPDLDTEHLESMSIWGDGGTAATVGGELQPATLRVRSRGTNYPGQSVYLTTPEDDTQSNAKANKLAVNDFVIGSDYKVDLRIYGRFLNYRIDDGIKDTSSGYTASNNKAWNISGLQLKVNKGGVK